MFLPSLRRLDVSMDDRHTGKQSRRRAEQLLVELVSRMPQLRHLSLKLTTRR